MSGSNYLLSTYPVVEDTVQMTEDWSLTLDEPMNRRVEDGALVLWRPGFTVWVNIFGNDQNETIPDILAWVQSQTSDAAFDVVDEDNGDRHLYAYRLDENATHAVYGFMLATIGHLMMAVYVDDPAEVPLALKLVRSIRPQI